MSSKHRNKMRNIYYTSGKDLKFGVNIFKNDALPNKNKVNKTVIFNEESLQDWKQENDAYNELIEVNRNKVWFERFIIEKWQEGIKESEEMTRKAMKQVMKPRPKNRSTHCPNCNSLRSIKFAWGETECLDCETKYNRI